LTFEVLDLLHIGTVIYPRRISAHRLQGNWNASDSMAAGWAQPSTEICMDFKLQTEAGAIVYQQE
jgi:hypothetical protein